MLEVLGMKSGHSQAVVSAANHGPRLASADFHGAMMEVVRSRCVSRVGLRGIVVRDTKFTFVLVTKNDQTLSKFST